MIDHGLQPVSVLGERGFEAPLRRGAAQLVQGSQYDCAFARDLRFGAQRSSDQPAQAADQLAARGGLRIGVIQGCYDRRQTGANRSQRGAFDGLIAQPGIVAGFGVEADEGQGGGEDGFQREGKAGGV